MRRTAVFALAVAAAALLPAVVGGAEEGACPDPAGTHVPFDPVVDDDGGEPERGEIDPTRMQADAEDPYALVLNGGGWGHGIGMSQYGARGAALLGCDHGEILGTYFPGTSVGTTDTAAPIRVGLWPAAPTGGPVTVINVDNVGQRPVTWTLHTPGQEPVGTDQPVGVRWTVRAEPGGGFTMRDGPEENAAIVWPEDGTVAGGNDSRLRASLGDGGDQEHLTRVHLTSKGRDYQRGTLDFVSRDHAEGRMLVVAELPSIEEYLYGLGEVPSSWPEETLQAQAVAGRSYAATTFPRDNCACDLYDSVYDQAYVGASKEDGDVGQRWVAAVDATVGEVLTYDFPDKQTAALADDGSDIVRAYYSSSNGGKSSAAWDIWGSSPEDFPYLSSVDTSAWEQVDMVGGADGGPDGRVDNPLHRWSFGVTADQLAAAFGYDEVTDVEIVEREPGGRPCLGTAPEGASPCTPRDLDDDGEPETIDGVVVTGRRGEETAHSWYSSEEVRWALGLLSGLVTMDGAPPPFEVPPVSVERLAGSGRIATAVALSNAGWPGGAPAVVLARADHPADALAGSALAGHLDAPMLLTATETLPEDVAAELGRLGATEAWLLGGAGAIGEEVSTTLRDLGVEPRRVSGPDRFATAGAVGAQLTLPDEQRTAYLVRMADRENPTREWADALSVSATAARRAGARAAWPVLGVADDVPDSTWTAIDELGITRVVPVGGSAVVTDAALEQMRERGIEVAERLAGSDRWATSRAVVAADTPSSNELVVATGMNFPDGLAAGAYAARVDGALLLTPTAYVPEATPWLPDEHPALVTGFGWQRAQVTVVGGAAAVEDPVAHELRRLLTEAATATADDG